MSTGKTVRMRNPLGGGCGWNGVAYEPDEHGVVTVPTEALLDLLSHEFRPVPDEPAPVAKEFGEWLQDSVDSVLDDPEPEALADLPTEDHSTEQHPHHRKRRH